MDIYNRFTEIIQNYSYDALYVDMPIGLSSSNFTRESEPAMRVQTKRKSCIFNVPVRESVYEVDDQKAKIINKNILGKSLSNQSLAIRQKIKEIDQLGNGFIRENKIYESHPELSFEKINSGKPLSCKKSRRSGIEERLAILERKNKKLARKYNDFQEQYKRKHVKRDDIVDAMILCYCAGELLENRYSSIFDKEILDDKGFDCNVYY